MGKRVVWFWPLGLCLGCAVFPTSPTAPPGSPAPATTLTEIQLAAQCLEKGDEAGALPHLNAYVEAHPGHAAIRVHLAEVLMKLDRKAEAKKQFEQYVCDAQQQGGEAGKHFIHVHTRLVELARGDGDEYGEHLHRGIGLYLLARERAGLPDPEEGELSVESVLCKAAGELTMARLARRDEARPSWYLYAVWSRLDQRQPALRHLREADATAPFSYLTPSEKRDLELARLGRDAEGRGAR